MTTEAFAAQARKHWKEWLPQKWRALREAGGAESAVRAAAQQAQAMKLDLMQAGYQEHEADEVVLAEYILLRPEPEEMDAEDLEREREYRKMMGPQEDTSVSNPEDLL